MDDLVELTRKHLEEEPDEEMDLLNEMTLDEGFLRIRIQDNGIGMKESILEKIFNS